MLREPRWLSRMLCDVIHSEMLQEHGGATGIRAGGSTLIDSALARPQQRFAYQPEVDLPSLAAAYLVGLVKNHGYVDGNTRVAFAAAATFLRLNGVRLTADEADAYELVVGAAASRYSEEDVATWMHANSEQVS